ncbi:hypothetical protein E2C01_065604 [Portunus trituberculatus]|uniref:Uncharacterized protein n=1 Tax=Portunus trituberculatus TaxID=210409 RepID=A0A5B7HRJ8_PORTR|nr:hypothetical protein [Portunus trituberculatus]
MSNYIPTTTKTCL